MTLAAAGAIQLEAAECHHWGMRPVLYHRIRMVIKIASNLPAFFVIVDFLFLRFGHHFRRRVSDLSKTRVAIKLN